MSKTNYFVTTAISYPNGEPHIGHAYEAIAADVIARHRGGELLTGTDEHGLKMVKTARELGMTPMELATKNSKAFRDMVDGLNVQYTRFIRTTDGDHHGIARWLWDSMRNHGDIYLDRYTGWYSVRDEAYFTEDDLSPIDGGFVVTTTQNPVEWIEEESYFFRLSKYRDALKKFHEENPLWLQPASSRNEVLNMLDTLEDISISRTTFDWGVPVPTSSPTDPTNHVMYVWVDALANYITGASHNWPVDLHVVGKDIVKFHAIFWPAFLMSAQVKLPGGVFAHGFLTVNGQRMSKSTGNVVNPMTAIEQFGVDRLRYYLMSTIPFGRDGDYSEDALKTKCNADLSNGFGNLISRVCKMIVVKFNGEVPSGNPTEADERVFAGVTDWIARTQTAFYDLEPHIAIESWMRGVNACNSYMQEQQPWAIKDDDDRVKTILAVLYRSIYNLAAAIYPVMPTTSDAIGAYMLAKPLAAPLAFFPRLP